MGRVKIPNKKVPVSCRVKPNIKRALEAIATAGKWKPAQALEIVVMESPRIKAELRNGKAVQ